MIQGYWRKSVKLFREEVKLVPAAALAEPVERADEQAIDTSVLDDLKLFD